MSEIHFRPVSAQNAPSSQVIIGILVLVGIFVLGWTSVFQIEPDEAGVVLRFGKYNRTVEHGLHFKLPLGVEKLYVLPVERQLKEEFGFRTEQAGVRSKYSNRSYLQESLMLTGDLNGAQIEWVCQFRISDPYLFLFKTHNPVPTLRDINEAVMREIVGDREVNKVLTSGKQEIASEAEKRIQKIANQYELGIRITQIILQDVNPPEQVKAAWNEVNEAQQEAAKIINQAKGEYNKVIPQAKGDAQRIIEEAKGYALERVNRAKGDSARFASQYFEYKKAKEVTKQRIYLESMKKILSKVKKKMITDDKASGILPLFQYQNGGLK